MATHQEAAVKSFFVYCPELSTKEGTEHLKVLFYFPDTAQLNRKIRNIGLCEALVNFCKTFSPDKPCETVHTQKTKQAFLEPEPGIWMTLTVTIPCSETIHNSERVLEYHEHLIQDSVVQAALQRSYNMFKLFNGTMRGIEATQSVEGLKKRLDVFYSRYWKNIDIARHNIFSVLQGIPFLPLDKYMYLKVHCFVNLVETTFRQIKRTVFVCGDQLVWSGLEQEDTRIFYQYLYDSWLRHNPNPEASGIPSVPAGPNTGSFILEDETGGKKNTWVYVMINQMLTPSRLFVYAVGPCVLCMFVQTDDSPGDDFIKRISVFLGPRLMHLTTEIRDFVSRNRSQSVEKQPYRMVYFNEMNLAIKSPLLSRYNSYLSITQDMMCLLTQLNAEYDKLNEGETVIRTIADYWIVARKNGHRRFFVLFTQKDVNFAEVNEEVRKICQKEFSNIYFFD
ncbi:PREDICTED: vacuolar fusion protein CCZ1 homolog [Amphimedon queenslandica]|uniref:CCZ1/INTU/HSP4 first Longin domain-containing protein n=1 Tax=Amphimedon queenslandica TaxID=400682 RepID=A0A1X7UK27_AMPQE|nr:PREDICTED: vacuolar fusion protein CCZ1 homolog [Amphimedon queenslandica]|eukprot:XP_003387660.1 PREDICTED: vacuolar fusion protein CCZ1 homolog [Amphimedon queenslandica]